MHLNLDHIRPRPCSIRLFNGLTVLFVCLMLGFLSSCQSNKDTSSENSVASPTIEEQAPALTKKRIVFFGNSLTAGFGLNEEQAFPAIIQQWIDSLNLPFIAVNAGLSGETTAGGDRRIDWVLKQEMDIFFLELGGNDMLRGTGVSTTESNLRSIVQKVRTKHPDIKIILAGMLAPPNMGKEYTDAFAAIYPTLANELELTLIPFFLEGVGGNPEFNQADGIHPNEAGHKIVAQTVWSYLYPLLSN